MKKSDFKYPHLFAPIQLGNVLFRNRIFASPTGYQNLNGDGYLNDGAAAYYGRKAMGGAASVATFEGICSPSWTAFTKPAGQVSPWRSASAVPNAMMEAMT